VILSNCSAEVLSPPFVIPNEVRNPLGVLTLPFTCIELQTGGLLANTSIGHRSQNGTRTSICRDSSCLGM